MAIRTYDDKIVGMAIKRTYDDSCAAAHALDLVGERWALLVVRELLLGPKRFTDLRAGLPHVSPNVLSQRLRELESAGVGRNRYWRTLEGGFDRRRDALSGAIRARWAPQKSLCKTVVGTP